jgi:hypothetical protein
MGRLSEALPTVPPGTRLVLIGVTGKSPFRWLTWYPTGPSAVIQAWFRDPTLDVKLEDEGDTGTAADRKAGDVVLVWKGDRFERPGGGDGVCRSTEATLLAAAATRVLHVRPLEARASGEQAVRDSRRCDYVDPEYYLRISSVQQRFPLTSVVGNRSSLSHRSRFSRS